ncbi:MAG: alginate export family protein [Chloroherpetonaceae bacterium]|nr:alginate export family protein [Chthonomonadaceae bacterium]MDW8206614.1 alginate export family protein [Chloroherpetonaceae bacterium]
MNRWMQGLTVLLAAGGHAIEPVQAQGTPGSKGGLEIIGSHRLRWEHWRWFETPGFQDTYNYVGSLLRVGVSRSDRRAETTLEFASPAFINLPANALAPPPQGALGLGANYRDSSGNQSAGFFIKQGFVRFRGEQPEDASLKIGRFEFGDGTEVMPPDPTLTWVKQNRIAQRLIGPFSFTHVGRSLDGLLYVQGPPERNTAFLFAFPTRGVFDVNGWDTLLQIQAAYLAHTRARKERRGSSETRWFAIYYGDARRQPVKTDNRPLAVRAADRNQIHIGTFGMHYLRALPVGSGIADGLFWLVGQIGQWGTLRHGAVAATAELGYQWPRAWGKPWVRLGYFIGSGDRDPSDSEHNTFIPLMPTPRLYARDPFYNESNVQDAFLFVILRPNPKLTLRADLHGIWLANPKDLWYAAGGAFNNQVFGFFGRTSGGRSYLATMADVSMEWQVAPKTTLTFYLAYVKGGDVIASAYAGTDSTFGLLELNHRF